MISSLQVVKSQHLVDPALSVLIRVKNEMRALPEFWSRLSSQTIFPRAEVLFLDSGSTDGTIEFLQNLTVNIYRIQPEDFCFGSTCNLLMDLSRAPVVCFLSGHVLLETPDALEKLHATLQGKTRAAAYLKQVPDEVFGANYYERAYLKRRYPDSGRALIEINDPGGFSNAASGLTRDAWKDNPFSEIHGAEDGLWAEEHLARGGRIFYLAGVAAMHSHRESTVATYRRVNSCAKARGLKGSYWRASYFFLGVLLSMIRMGSSFREAFEYALGHARAYLPQSLRLAEPSRPVKPEPLEQRAHRNTR